MDQLVKNIFDEEKYKLMKSEGQEVKKATNELAARGQFQSGAHIMVMTDIRKKYAESLLDAFINSYTTVSEESGGAITPTFEAEARAELDQLMISIHSRMSGEMKATAQLAHFNHQTSIDASVNQIVASLTSSGKRRIDIWAEKSRRKTNRMPTRQVDPKLVFIIKRIAKTRLDVDDFYEKVIKLSCKAFGLNPKPVDQTEGNDTISTRALKLIDNSLFVIADLTYERQNCYFEAGYAMGRNIPIIYTAREDHDPRRPHRTDGSHKVHFDLDSHTITFWSASDFNPAAVELKNRIEKMVEHLK